LAGDQPRIKGALQRRIATLERTRDCREDSLDADACRWRAAASLIPDGRR